MKLIDTQDADNIKNIFEKLKESVNLVLFNQPENLQQNEIQSFLEDVASLSNKINLSIYTADEDAEYTKKLNIDKFPAIAVLDKVNKDTGIRFYGMPIGQQIHPFIKSILETSGFKDPIPKQIEKKIKNVKKSIRIEVFVELKCKYSPLAVMAAQRLALENTNIMADMVDCRKFSSLAKSKNIRGTPTIIINNKVELTGAQNFVQLLAAINKV
ncbi:MAG: hypothetical protein A2Y40_09225 [Candidatus Margulisbacteria bacterium GWF2_35_9]|nr:MAG: hypothetical protein A2Y40_09225 [Candidatus Margulisbacteria bacterium GWF2_35_9]